MPLRRYGNAIVLSGLSPIWGDAVLGGGKRF